MTNPLTSGKLEKQAKLLTQRTQQKSYNFPMSIGDEIRKARIACKLSQRELALAVGVSHGLVGQWESGVKKPGRDNLIAIAQTTMVMIESLLENGEIRPLTIQIHDPLEIEVVRALRRMALPQKKNLVQFLRVAGDVAGEIQKKGSPSKV